MSARRAGETIDLAFPITTRTVKETIGTVPYTLEIKGNTVVSIDPPGKTAPFTNAHITNLIRCHGEN